MSIPRPSPKVVSLALAAIDGFLLLSPVPVPSVAVLTAWLRAEFNL